MLNGNQVGIIHSDLLKVYTYKKDLQIMVRRELDEYLDTITVAANLSHIIFDLIEWAEKHDRITDLVNGAYQDYPRILGELHGTVRSWNSICNINHNSVAIRTEIIQAIDLQTNQIGIVKAIEVMKMLSTHYEFNHVIKEMVLMNAENLLWWDNAPAFPHANTTLILTRFIDSSVTTQRQ